MARGRSRPARWAEAVANAKAAASKLEGAKAGLVEAFGPLEDLRNEYEEWRDTVPENLQGSPLYEKLEAIVELDFSEDTDVDAMLEAVEGAEQVELPLGFGRD